MVWLRLITDYNYCTVKGNTSFCCSVLTTPVGKRFSPCTHAHTLIMNDVKPNSQVLRLM